MRVSFYWGEGDDAPGGWVPVQFTRRLAPSLRVMRGTEASRPRCMALEGEVGRAVRCTIYDQRPSPCREFEWHGENGEPNNRCNQRRLAAGLPALPDPPGRASPPTADVQAGAPA
jgi:Fe-S-cluster containining protein